MAFELITSLSKMGNLLSDLSKTDIVSLDTETSGLDPFDLTLILLQLKPLDTTYIIDCREIKNTDLVYLMKLLQDKKVIAHNAKFDLKVLAVASGILLKNVYDTLTGEVIITNGIGFDRMPSLETLVLKYKNIQLNKETRKAFIDNPTVAITNEILIYSAMDVEFLKDIMAEQLKKVEEQNQQKVVKIEMDLVPVVSSMELNGVLLNTDAWSVLVRKAEKEAEEKRVEIIKNIIIDFMQRATEIKVEIDGKIETGITDAYRAFTFFKIPVRTKKLRKELESMTELSFIKDFLVSQINVNSNPQILNVLNTMYGLNIESTNEKIINKFAGKSKIVDDLLEYREKQKKATSFGENVSGLINKKTGMLHSDFNQIMAKSGRFSSSDPNLCNIPKEDEYRSCFVAPAGWKMLCLDYDQQELRVMAHVSHEKKMIDAFIKGTDLHELTAKNLFQKDVVTKEERRIGKTLNFAVGYGSSEYGLYKNFGIPYEDGKEYLDTFFNKIYTTLRDFIQIAGNLVLEKGYSVTLSGRKRFFEKKVLFKDYKEAMKYTNSVKREGVNHIIQGSSADCTKIALSRIFYENPFGEDSLKIIIQVYDEIVCIAKEEIAEKALEFVKEKMLQAESLFVGEIPPAVTGKVSEHWIK